MSTTCERAGRSPAGIVVVLSGWPRISETFALNELLALHRAGLLAAVFATKAGDPTLCQPGRSELDHLTTVLADGTVLEQAAELVAALGPRPVAAVHGYFAHQPTAVAAAAAELLGVPYGFSTHALDARKVDPTVLADRCARARVVIACNGDTAATLRSVGANPVVVPHGVDLERFWAEPPTERPAPSLLAVGRLVEKKGFAVLIDALSTVGGPWALQIVGDGPERRAIEDLVETHGLTGRVSLLGRRTHHELPALYRDADLVVVPSVRDRNGDRDGLPNVVLEAMASSRAIVASAVAAIPDALADGRTGRLVTPGDPDALAAALGGLLADRAERARLGAAARADAERRFDLGRCGDRFCRTLTDAYGIEPEAAPGRVAYVLKGYPRISELFIASEIHRLEQLGVDIGLYVVKARDEQTQHAVVDRVRARPRRLPPTTSLTASTVPAWLRVNLPQFLPQLCRVARRHPRGLVTAVGHAASQAVRARKGWRPRAVYLKELLCAVALVDAVDHDGGAAHLHAHFAHGTTTITWLASSISGIPFSFTGHAKDIYRESLNPAGLLARKMRVATFVATCTAANVEHLRSVEPTAEIHLVYHGLNADFGELVAAAGPRTAPERLRIVSVGRQVPKKGFDVLVDSVAILRDRGLDPELVVAGEHGPAHHDLIERIQRHGLGDRVALVGPVSQRDLLELYRSATVFALACRIDDDGDRDGIPNVLVEAMAAGLPVVSTDVSGIPEVVAHDQDGLLVPPVDADALADAIHRIAKDPSLAERLGRAAATTIEERFDGVAHARRMAILLEGPTS